MWYLISRKQFIRKIREIYPMRNLRLLQYVAKFGGCNQIIGRGV